jgi:hypothetical protein
MTDRTVSERQRRQVLRDRAAGIVRVTVKVPAEAAEQVRTLADILRVQRMIDQPFTPEDDTP